MFWTLSVETSKKSKTDNKQYNLRCSKFSKFGTLLNCLYHKLLC